MVVVMSGAVQVRASDNALRRRHAMGGALLHGSGISPCSSRQVPVAR